MKIIAFVKNLLGFKDDQYSVGDSSRKFLLDNKQTIVTPTYMENRGGLLYNANTQNEEALPGDYVLINKDDQWEFYGIASNYSDFQSIPLVGKQVYIASAEKRRSGIVRFQHNTYITREIT